MIVLINSWDSQKNWRRFSFSHPMGHGRDEGRARACPAYNMVPGVFQMLLFGYLATAAFSIPPAEQAQPAPAPDTATARAASLAELFGDPVLARGQGVEIKRSQLDDAFTAWKANLAARGQTIVEEQRTFRESQLLDKLIITQLLMNRASAGDKAVAKAQAEKFITER